MNDRTLTVSSLYPTTTSPTAWRSLRRLVIEALAGGPADA